MSGANWPRVAAGVALEALVFLAFGPLIGTVVFLIAFGAFAGDIGRGLSALAMMAIYFPLFIVGYALAWKAALAGGLLVGLASAWMIDGSIMLVFAAVAGALASALLIEPVVAPGMQWQIMAAVAAAGAVASLVCAWLAGRMRLPQLKAVAAQ